MYEPTTLTWILGISGIILYIPGVYIQFFALLKPHDDRTKTLLLGKGGDYFDATYFRFCQGTGWADLLIHIPFVFAGCILALMGVSWGYMIWFAGAAITFYIHLVLLFVEGKHIYNRMGLFALLTYFWGVWFYWALIVMVYCLCRANGVAL